MYIDTTYKNRLAVKLSHRMGTAIQNGELPDSQIGEACDMILAAIGTMTNREDVVAFFSKLSLCWPFFQEVIDEEDRQSTIVNNITDTLLARGTSH